MGRLGEECTCEWERHEGMEWKSDQPLYITIHPLSSSDQCELACCYRELGCAAYTFTPDGVCKIWVDLQGAVTMKTEDARSGVNAGHHQCKAPAGVDPNHPEVPFDYDLGIGWFVVAAIVCVALVYILVGTLIIPERGKLPNRIFWREFVGLVRDGFSFVLNRGSLPVGSNGKPEAASASGLREGLLPQQSNTDQASRGRATPLHIAAQLGDARGLENLLQGDKRFRPPIDAGDAKRYTALHCACAGGHADCAQLLIAAGCRVDLTNDIGLTARAVAEQLKRSNILGLEFSPTARDSAGQTAVPADSPTSRPQQRVPVTKTIPRTSSGLEESRKLKAELKARGLSTKGSKAELRARLAEAAVELD